MQTPKAAAGRRPLFPRQRRVRDYGSIARRERAILWMFIRTPRPGEASTTLALRHGRVDNLLKAYNWCPPDIRARLGDSLSHERLRVRRMPTGISFTVPRTHRQRLADQRSHRHRSTSGARRDHPVACLCFGSVIVTRRPASRRPACGIVGNGFARQRALRLRACLWRLWLTSTSADRNRCAQPRPLMEMIVHG